MSEAIIKKNGTDYPLQTMPLHYPADRVYLDGDISKTVQDFIDKLPLEVFETTGTTDASGYFNLGSNAKIIACIPKDYHSACKITDILVNQWDITYVVTDQPNTQLTLVCLRIKS